MSSSQNGYVTIETANSVCTIEFFHPQGNSLPSEMLLQLTSAINKTAADPDASVVILRSAGTSAFCAGASFDELASIRTKEDGLAFFNGFASLINSMRKCPKLIIGRIHGKCAGGGVGLAAACDYAIASTNAAIKLSELSVGIGPFVIGPVLELKIGRAAFCQLAIDTYNWRSSQWALDKGLFATLYDDIETLENGVNVLAEKLKNTNPRAMEAIKEICWQGTEDWDELLSERAAISGDLVLSSFTQNAIRAFKTQLKSAGK